MQQHHTKAPSYEMEITPTDRLEVICTAYNACLLEGGGFQLISQEIRLAQCAASLSLIYSDPDILLDRCTYIQRLAGFLPLLTYLCTYLSCENTKNSRT